MKRLHIVLLFFIGIVAISSCEKDDICVEGDTPLLVIEFYNIADTSALKNVPTLRVVGVGQNITVNTVADRSATNKITIPLKTNENSTSFIMISNSADAENGSETGNIDTVNFSYTRLENFLSRGCGFVVNYNELQAEITEDASNWIQNIEVTRAQVINSDSTHVKIFH